MTNKELMADMRLHLDIYKHLKDNAYNAWGKIPATSRRHTDIETKAYQRGVNNAYADIIKDLECWVSGKTLIQKMRHKDTDE